jgi:hypothetical protein
MTLPGSPHRATRSVIATHLAARVARTAESPTARSSAGAVEKHVRSILTKLHIPASDKDHCQLLAVLLCLDSR